MTDGDRSAGEDDPSEQTDAKTEQSETEKETVPEQVTDGGDSPGGEGTELDVKKEPAETENEADPDEVTDGGRSAGEDVPSGRPVATTELSDVPPLVGSRYYRRRPRLSNCRKNCPYVPVARKARMSCCGDCIRIDSDILMMPNRSFWHKFTKIVCRSVKNAISKL